MFRVRLILANLGVAVLSLLPLGFAISCEISVCENKPRCVADKFEYFYEHKNEALWEYLYSASKTIEKCKVDSEPSYGGYLYLFSKNHGNAEFMGFADDVVTGVLLNSSNCMIDSLLILDADSRVGILRLFAQSVSYDGADINKVFKELPKTEKYESLVSQWENIKLGKTK